MLKEKITSLLEVLQANVTAIAELADTDPSNISRIKNGTRSYQINSKTIDRLLGGILLYAEKEQKNDLLDQLIRFQGGSRKEALRSWLFQDVRQPDAVTTLSAFPDKLNALIHLANLSNARLARLTNIDPSYISRLRSGSRIPRAGSTVYETLSRVLFDEITKAGHLGTLQKMISSDASGNTDDLFQSYVKWLSTPQKNDVHIESLLSSINQLSPTRTFSGPLRSLQEQPDRNITYELRDNYYDSRGLQEASLRFLSDVVQSDSRMIYLFSENQIDWMTQDPVFLQKWTFLMLLLLQKGIRIRIIHNIDRSIPEMVDAVKSWLPLYMSGLIEPWYMNIKGGKRFQHTLFLCPGVASVTSVQLFQDSHAVFHYDTDPKYNDYCLHLFQGLMKKSMPLMQIEKAASLPGKNEGLLLTGQENIRISIEEASVTVTRVTEPKISFTILNRHLCDAIKAYCDA